MKAIGTGKTSRVIADQEAEAGQLSEVLSDTLESVQKTSKTQMDKLGKHEAFIQTTESSGQRIKSAIQRPTSRPLGTPKSPN